MDTNPRLVIAAWAAFVVFGALIYAHYLNQQAAVFRTRMANEQTIQVSAASARGRAIARTLLAPRLAKILDPKAPTYETDAAFAEAILADAVATLFRYQDIARDEYSERLVASLAQGVTFQAIEHFKRTLTLRAERRDTRGMARSYLSSGALYLISDYSRAASELHIAADLDPQVASCMDCLNRLIIGLRMTVLAEVEQEPQPASAPTPSPAAPKAPSTKGPAVKTEEKRVEIKPRTPPAAASPTPTTEEPDPVVESSPPVEQAVAEPVDVAPSSQPTLPSPAENVRAVDVRPLVRHEPEYPEQALRRGIEGYAVVEFVITRSGKTVDIHTVEASPPGVFDGAAEAAIRKWHYGKGVGPLAGVRVRFEFKLK